MLPTMLLRSAMAEHGLDGALRVIVPAMLARCMAGGTCHIAKAEDRCRARLTQLLGLSCLAPDILTAIVEGRQPPTLTARTLAGVELPMAWPEQRAAPGFS